MEEISDISSHSGRCDGSGAADAVEECAGSAEGFWAAQCGGGPDDTGMFCFRVIHAEGKNENMKEGMSTPLLLRQNS